MSWRRIARGIKSGVLRGFTLVELLVVIGIIALLIAILTPALSRARKQALQASCGSNARQVVYAALAYANDWKEQLPSMYADACLVDGECELEYGCGLPIIGFDSVTIWDYGTFAPYAGGYPCYLGGGARADEQLANFTPEQIKAPLCAGVGAVARGGA